LALAGLDFGTECVPPFRPWRQRRGEDGLASRRHPSRPRGTGYQASRELARMPASEQPPWPAARLGAGRSSQDDARPSPRLRLLEDRKLGRCVLAFCGTNPRARPSIGHSDADPFELNGFCFSRADQHLPLAGERCGDHFVTTYLEGQCGEAAVFAPCGQQPELGGELSTTRPFRLRPRAIRAIPPLSCAVLRGRHGQEPRPPETTAAETRIV
jgi:hypothetical protein